MGTGDPLRVVVAGGGVAGLEAVLGLRALAGQRVETTLLAPDDDFVFRPLSVGEPFALGDAQRVPLEKVARDTGARLRKEALESVDPGARTVTAGTGSEIPYDELIVAHGARRVSAYEHAITFRGQEDVETLRGLVLDVEEGYSRRIAFIVPTGVVWTLPIYELALMTARRGFESSNDAEVVIATPEPGPLAVFGDEASAAVARLLDEAGIRMCPGVAAEVTAKGRVTLGDGETLEAERIVALPRVEGQPVAGLPADAEGFIPVDEHMRVEGLESVFAVGDGANFPLKQGGIACQQADVAVEQIAQRAGAQVDPEPFRPVLRGQLLTGARPQFLRHAVDRDDADASTDHILWWPPAKVAGRYLAPYLGSDAVRDALEDSEPLDVKALKFAERR